MLDQLNRYLPAITLSLLITALYMVSNDATYTQNLITESFKAQADQQQQLFALEQRQSALGVRLVRVESDLCRLGLTNAVQCALNSEAN